MVRLNWAHEFKSFAFNIRKWASVPIELIQTVEKVIVCHRYVAHFLLRTMAALFKMLPSSLSKRLLEREMTQMTTNICPR